MRPNRKAILMLFIALFITSTFAITTRTVHAAIINVVPGLNAIQNAVNAASPGDTINVAAGIYPEAITIPKQLFLIGAPGAKIQPIAANPPQDGTDRDGIYITAGSVQVKGFEIDGTNGFVTKNGIYGLSTNGLDLENNVIHDMVNNVADNGGVGIIIFGWGASCNNNLISGNVVYNTARMGIWVGAMQSSSPNGWLVCSGNVISWNVVYNTWQGPTNDGGGGIQWNGAKNTLIYDNQVHDTKTPGPGGFYAGIYGYGSDTGNSITCNDVYNNKYGIVTWIAGSGDVVFGTDVPTSPTTETNNIYQNTNYGVWNVAAPTLDATKNWWDSKNGPGSVGPGSGDHVTANVDYSSYLSSPASCAPHFTLTVTSAHDLPNPAVGANVAPPGWIVTASITSPVAGATGTQYVSTGWTGTGDVLPSGTGTTTTFTITQDSSITWLWKTQYYLTVTSLYDSPTGAGWHDSGSTVTASVTSPTGNARSTGWTGTGDVPASGTATTVTFTMTQASAITWNWALGPVKAPSVGGQWTPITMQALSPLNTLGLMAPWIALALIAAAIAVATYRRLLKKHSIPTSA